MTGGISDREEDRMQAAEYALGLLPEAEALAFEARLAAEPELRAAYAGWCEDFAGMTDGIAPETPPKALWSRIEAQVFAETPKARLGLWQRLGIGALLGAAAVMLVLWLGPYMGLFTGPGAPDLVASIEAEDGSVHVTAGFDSESRELMIAREAGQPAEGRAYELWLIEGDNPPVSLGVLPEPRRAVILLPRELAARMGQATLAISDEPEGGSPTGQPTGDVLAVGEVITAS